MKVVLKDLTKKFSGQGKNAPDVIAVNNFNVEIPDGKLIGLLGPWLRQEHRVKPHLRPALPYGGTHILWRGRRYGPAA